MPEMRGREILTEAVRNVGSGTTRAVLLALLAGVLFSLLTWSDVTALLTVIRAADAVTAGAGSVRGVESGERIDGAACEALGRTPGVRAAGALRSVDRRVSLGADPDGSVPLFEATPGFARLLGASVDPSGHTGVIIPRRLADELRIGPGATLTTTAGDLHVQGVYAYPDDGRLRGPGYALIAVTAASGAFDSCWADIWPDNPDAQTLLWTTVAAGGKKGEQPSMKQFNPSFGASFQAGDAWRERVTRFNEVIAGVMLALLAAAAMRLRRLELASALHAGVSRPALRLQLMLEALAWSGFGVVLALPTIALGVHLAAGPDQGIAVDAGVRVLGSGVAGALVGTLAAASVTREDHLFTYFKER